MSVVLDKSDIPFINSVYNSLMGTISSLPHGILKSNRCGAWIIVASANVFCNVIKLMKLDKEKAMEIIGEIWDNKEGKNIIFN